MHDITRKRICALLKKEKKKRKMGVHIPTAAVEVRDHAAQKAPEGYNRHAGRQTFCAL